MQCKENLIKIQDPQSQTECDTTPGKEYSTETDSGDTETIKTSAIQKFMLKILTDDEIVEGLNLLKFKAKEGFQCDSYISQRLSKIGLNVEPVDIFLSDSRGTRKVVLLM